MESVTNNYEKDIKTHLVEYFKVVKTYSEKYNIVFLSKRFQLVYYCLKQEHPEIDLNSSMHYDNTLFINDINYELPSRIGKSDWIFTLLHVYHFLPFCELSYPIPWSLDDIKLASQEELFIPKRYNRIFHVQLKGFWHTIMYGALDFFAQEINLLYENNITDVLELLPNFLINYFTFWAKNQEPLEYFIKNYYTRCFIEDTSTEKQQIELKNKIIKEILEKYGRENISIEFLTWLDNIRTSYLYMNHTPVKCNVATTRSSDIKVKELKSFSHNQEENKE